MKALKCDGCGHIMTTKEYDDFPECPMCNGHYFTGVRYRKCDCDCCKSKKPKTVTTYEDYSQFVSCLESRGRTDLIEEQILHAAVGLAGESGELLDKVKKVYWQRHPLNEKWFEDATRELGDILFYLQFMCNCLGVTLEDIRDGNVTKLSGRYKTGKFTVNESVNRKS